MWEPRKDKEGMPAAGRSACPGGMRRGTTGKCNQAQGIQWLSRVFTSKVSRQLYEG